MIDDEKIDVASNYVKTVNGNETIYENQGEEPYSGGIAKKVDKYVETTEIKENGFAEYEATKIVKCRKYKLYKKEN